MQIRSEREGGHCKVDINGQDKDHKAHRQLLFEKHKLQKTTVVQDIVYTGGHRPGVDLTLRRQLLQNEKHRCLRICWERILPQHCLRVLLVEGDNSTRHVISALLWHCSYEVTAVANGLEAWDLLKDPSNHFNIVLTEVAMPCLAGIGLLRKIASHEIYRNIPVIMMSSLDSMNLIFKCLTMGAADFLIKPVRKNELRNIWKHIWKRRQYDGNEDPEEKGKYEHDQHHIVPISSHTTKPKKEQFQDMFIPLLGTLGQHSDQNRSDRKMGENLEMYFTRETSPGHQHFQEEMILCNQTCAENKDAPSLCNQDSQIGKAIVVTCGHESAEPCREAIDLMGAISRKYEGRNVEAENDTGKVDKKDNERHKKDDTISDSNFFSLLELNLKKPEPISGEGSVPENSVLRQSVTSAFSRYNTKCSQIQHPSGGSIPCNTHSSPKDHELNCTMNNLGTKQTGSGSQHRLVPFDRPNHLKRSDIDVSIPVAKQLETSHTVNNQDDKVSVISSSGQDNFPFQLQMKDDKESLDTSVRLEMLMPVPLVYGSIPAYYGAAFHDMIYSQPNTLSKHTTKDQKTHTRNECDISCCEEQQILSSQTTQSSQHETHHYYIQHHYHCCESKEKVCPHQHSKHEKQTMNNSVMLKASTCGMYSMVSHNLDGSHQEAGSNGTGSVSKASCITENQTNGQNDCYYHLFNKPLHQKQSRKPQHPEGDEQIMNNSGIAGLMCFSCNNGQTGSSNVYESLNATEHGNNNRINEQTDHLNGQSCAIVIPKTNEESGAVNGVTHGGETGRGAVNQNQSSQREAALTKFRLKRKERCFEKKVRYQSRKKLAEQRPWVRGQFVQQAAHESRTGDMG